MDGRPYADGGVADPIPIRRAIQDGATDITVVLTHNPAFRLKPIPRWMGKLAYPEFPLVAQVWTARQNVNYNDALDLMKQLRRGIRIQVFRPLRPMPVGSFTVEQKQIAARPDPGPRRSFGANGGHRGEPTRQFMTQPILRFASEEGPERSSGSYRLSERFILNLEAVG